MSGRSSVYLGSLSVESCGAGEENAEVSFQITVFFLERVRNDAVMGFLKTLGGEGNQKE